MTPNCFATCPVMGEELSYQSEICQSSGHSLHQENGLEIVDGLPRSVSGQNFIHHTASNLEIYRGGCPVNPPLPVFQSQMSRAQSPLSYHNLHSGEYLGAATSNFDSTNDDLFHVGISNGLQSCGTIWSPSYISNPDLSFVQDLELPSKFLPVSSEVQYFDEANRSTMDYSLLEIPGGLADISISSSPTIESHLSSGSPSLFENPPTAIAKPSSMGSEDGEVDGADDNLSTCEERVFDEPYAKLIYRALMAAPNHSMVLQEIYQWFIDNTEKGNSASAGWRNSIRHNLSMNAAFRKTDRTPVGENTKKTSEWVLEPFAIKNGVTPTTRYRKTTVKATKSDNPAPARVRSGRAGGLSAWKSKSHRRMSREGRRAIKVEKPADYMLGNDYYQRPTLPETSLDVRSSCMAASNEFSSHHRPNPSLGNSLHFSNIREVHGGDGPIFYKEEPDVYGDRPPYSWGTAYY